MKPAIQHGRSRDARVLTATPVQIHAVAIDDSESLTVPFDNFSSKQPPLPGADVTVWQNGWTLGRYPRKIWSLEPSPIVSVPSFRVELSGFRTGRRRHLKFLLHGIGLDRRAFRSPAPHGKAFKPMMKRQDVQTAIGAAACPAEGVGERACKNFELGCCFPEAYWRLEPSIAAVARRYEEGVLDSASSKNLVGCVVVAPSEDAASDGSRPRVLSMLLADPTEDVFIEAAAVPHDPDRYMLLSAWVTETGALSKLLRKAERADYIKNVCGSHVAREVTNQLLLIQRRKELERRARLTRAEENHQ